MYLNIEYLPVENLDGYCLHECDNGKHKILYFYDAILSYTIPFVGN